MFEDRHSVTAVFGLHQDSDPQTLHAPVLVLNASYEPINICAALRAIVLVLKGVAMTEEENGQFLHAARLAFDHPLSGARIEIHSALPADLAQALERAERLS